MLARAHFAILVVVSTTPGALLAQEPKGKGTTKVRIHGTVVNSKGDPMKGVIVSLNPTGKTDSVQTKPTDRDGTYDFGMVTVASAYDLMYCHSSIDPAVISRLSETKDQEIHTVVYGHNELRPPTEALAAIRAAERMLVLMSIDEVERRGEFQRMIQVWKETKSFMILGQKISSIVPENTPRKVREYIEMEQQAVQKAFGDLAR